MIKFYSLKMKIVCFIQARMSSKRFPGKVLEKLEKKEVLKYLIERLENKIKKINVIVLTSNNKTDKKIISFCKKNNYEYKTGSLNNVFSRFKKSLKKLKVDGFIRITGDSPLIDISLLKKMINLFKKGNHDIVTNVFPRSYPIGQSAELFKKKIFVDVSEKKLNNFEKEHISQYFYKNYKKYKIFNFTNSKNSSSKNLSINTKSDLLKLRKILKNKVNNA